MENFVKIEKFTQKNELCKIKKGEQFVDLGQDEFAVVYDQKYYIYNDLNDIDEVLEVFVNELVDDHVIEYCLNKIYVVDIK